MPVAAPTSENLPFCMLRKSTGRGSLTTRTSCHPSLSKSNDAQPQPNDSSVLIGRGCCGNVIDSPTSAATSRKRMLDLLCSFGRSRLTPVPDCEPSTDLEFSFVWTEQPPIVARTATMRHDSAMTNRNLFSLRCFFWESNPGWAYPRTSALLVLCGLLFGCLFNRQSSRISMKLTAKQWLKRTLPVGIACMVAAIVLVLKYSDQDDASFPERNLLLPDSGRIPRRTGLLAARHVMSAMPSNVTIGPRTRCLSPPGLCPTMWLPQHKACLIFQRQLMFHIVSKFATER